MQDQIINSEGLLACNFLEIPASRTARDLPQIVQSICQSLGIPFPLLVESVSLAERNRAFDLMKSVIEGRDPRLLLDTR
jgi:hypothetical protein